VKPPPRSARAGRPGDAGLRRGGLGATPARGLPAPAPPLPDSPARAGDEAAARRALAQPVDGCRAGNLRFWEKMMVAPVLRQRGGEVQAYQRRVGLVRKRAARGPRLLFRPGPGERGRER
jgi:hypothetical protein